MTGPALIRITELVRGGQASRGRDKTVTETSTDDYLPIGDYGLIGNRHTAALVSRNGSIDWLCWPRFDSPSIFAKILDPGLGGSWSVQPTGEHESHHRYIRDTNILETFFVCPEGKISLLDFMDMSWAEQEMEGGPPGKLVRLIRGLEGNVETTSVCRPRPNYARKRCRVELRGSEASIDDFIMTGPGGWLEDREDGSISHTFIVRPGEQYYFTMASDIDKSPLGSIHSSLHSTQNYWVQWANKCTYNGPYRDMVVRSALVMQLLTYAPSGAIVAAPTTSLPEEIGGGATGTTASPGSATPPTRCSAWSVPVTPTLSSTTRAGYTGRPRWERSGSFTPSSPRDR